MNNYRITITLKDSGFRGANVSASSEKEAIAKAKKEIDKGETLPWKHKILDTEVIFNGW